MYLFFRPDMMDGHSTLVEAMAAGHYILGTKIPHRLINILKMKRRAEQLPNQ